MRNSIAMVLLLVLGAHLSANDAKPTDAEQAAKEQQQTARAEQKKAKQKDRRVCKRQKVTGSRIPERVCRKQSEWTRIQDRARENVERTREGSDRAIGGQGES